MKKRKKIIAVLDNDLEFITQFSNIFKNSTLLKEYKVKPFIIAEKPDIEKRIKELKKDKKLLDVILVDIVLFEMDAPRELLSGLMVAQTVRIEFPNLPILMITKHIENHYLPLLGWCSLEDVDGILIKQYLSNDKKFTNLIPISENDIIKIFEKAKKKRNDYISGLFLDSSADLEIEKFNKIKKLYQLDEISASQVKEIGSTAFVHLSEELFQDLAPHNRGIISHFRPGFSGSYLFKIEHNKETGRAWLLKLDKKEKIKNEFNNYKAITNILPRDNYPDDIKEYVTFGRWGAFAVSIQKEAITLFDYINLLNRDEEFPLEKKLIEILKKINGNKERVAYRLWKELYKFSFKIWLKLLAFFEDYRWLLEEYFSSQMLDELKGFVYSYGKSLDSMYEKSYSIEMGMIHGDLNARNILIHPDSRRIVLIDFANYEHGHIARDIAKLEADIIFASLDSKNKNYYNWKRIDRWSELLPGLVTNNIFELKINKAEEEIEKVNKIVIKLRKYFKNICCTEISDAEYLISLLYYCFHYLTYPDISIQKKIFVVRYIYKILSQLKN